MLENDSWTDMSRMPFEHGFSLHGASLSAAAINGGGSSKISALRTWSSCPGFIWCSENQAFLYPHWLQFRSMLMERRSNNCTVHATQAVSHWMSCCYENLIGLEILPKHLWLQYNSMAWNNRNSSGAESKGWISSSSSSIVRGVSLSLSAWSLYNAH